MKIVLLLTLGAIIIVAAFVYGLFGSQSNPSELTDGAAQPADMIESEAEPENKIVTGESTLAELAARQENLECRISYVPEDTINPVVGTYFVSGGDIRGDFEIETAELGSFVSSIIYTDNMFYSWSEIQGQMYGVKVNTSLFDQVGEESLNEPVPMDTSVSYECFPWVAVDGSVFIPPSEVLFQDLSTILERGMEIGTMYEEGEF